ncbi:MAG TPA: hypothetical protein VG944_02345 [Fimbriimonas sp.]|nr:hypothetical protein [Fimbriimonas sp.]
MKATNQGFVDLHTPAGFFLIGIAFLLFSAVIFVGALYIQKIAARDRETRRLMKEELAKRKPSG